MISREDAYACLEAAAADLKSLSYEQLENLTERYAPDGQAPDIVSQVESQTVYIGTLIQKFGRFRKRISVEMMLSVEDEWDPSRYPFIYFERFESGRFYPSPREEAREAALYKALPYVFISGVVIVLLALVWHLFLRGG